MKDYPIQDDFHNIIDIIGKSMNIEPVEAGLLLIRDALIQREDSKKNLKIYKEELFRDGIEVMEYLFDILNYIAGFHEIQMNLKNSSTIYPHVVLALEAVQNLWDMSDSERRPLDYIHTIMLRLYVYNF